MIRKISLSLNPTYLCNFRCKFCYLTDKQLGDRKKMSLNVLEKRLIEIKSYNFKIDHVDIYGGEVALLPESYLEQMDNIISEHENPSINVITNFSKKHPYLLKEHVSLSVSFDFEAREKHELVLSNILTTNKNVAILILASRQVLEMDVDKMIQIFNSIRNIVSVEIKPYSSNQANQLPVSDSDFEDFVKKWIFSNEKKKFNFTNEENIKNVLNKNRNAFSDDHIYITPSGKFAVLEFDDRHHELFLELDSFEEYLDWTSIEKKRVYKNKICSQCEYLGRCLTEHYREVISLDNSCNGFRNLINDYKNLNPPL